MPVLQAIKKKKPVDNISFLTAIKMISPALLLFKKINMFPFNDLRITAVSATVFHPPVPEHWPCLYYLLSFFKHYLII